MEASGASVLPVDSEHNAIFQVLGGGDAREAELVTITASGGPFREWPLESMRAATVEQAVAHPNWSMGRKISVDSATLMNKGLELIEAHFLFALPPEKLGVVVHPQSIVHCLVSYDDGTTMAHLSAPDMRTPIAHALGWPRRISSPSRRLDLATLGQLIFQPPAHDRFPALNLAIGTMRSGGLAPTVLNAANEIAVQAFLDRRIGFLDIPRVVEAKRWKKISAATVRRGPGHGADRRCAGARAGARDLRAGGALRRDMGMPASVLTGWLLTPTGLLAFLCYITLVVFVHEMGHFLMARGFGAKVEVFSVGFGPEIFGFNDRRGTRWKLSWIPVGGYVKFVGDADAASTPDRAAVKASAAERAQMMFVRPVYQRALVAVAARWPISSWRSSLFFGLFLYSGHTTHTPLIGQVIKASAAEAAGFTPGDTSPASMAAGGRCSARCRRSSRRRAGRPCPSTCCARARRRPSRSPRAWWCERISWDVRCRSRPSAWDSPKAPVATQLYNPVQAFGAACGRTWA